MKHKPSYMHWPFQT